MERNHNVRERQPTISTQRASLFPKPNEPKIYSDIDYFIRFFVVVTLTLSHSLSCFSSCCCCFFFIFLFERILCTCVSLSVRCIYRKMRWNNSHMGQINKKGDGESVNFRIICTIDYYWLGSSLQSVLRAAEKWANVFFTSLHKQWKKNSNCLFGSNKIM